MIFDNIKNIETYETFSPFIERISLILTSIYNDSFNFDKPPMFEDGFKIIFINKEIEHDRTTYRLERHRQNIDFHFVVEGIDEIGIKKTDKCTLLNKPYNTDGDYELFDDEPEYKFKLMAGDFLLITPAHAHDTLLRKGSVKKFVFKIPIR